MSAGCVILIAISLADSFQVQGLNVIGWAITGFGTAGAQNKAGLYTVRLLLGYFEGVGHTGVTIVVSNSRMSDIRSR